MKWFIFWINLLGAILGIGFMVFTGSIANGLIGLCNAGIVFLIWREG